MGITFRDGHYVNHIRIGKRTIKEGEFALVWDVNGRCKKYHGPRLVYFWFSTIRFCTNYIANEKQYLVVSHKDGRTVHTRGPCSLHLDHLLHQNIEVHDAIQVNADECLAVFNEDMTSEEGSDDAETTFKEIGKVSEDGIKYSALPNSDEIELEAATSKEIVKASAVDIKYGPCLFFPKVRERVEEFKWLDNSETLCMREKRDSVKIMCKTKDDHELKVNFTFVWKVNRGAVHKLLLATQDPLADLTFGLKVYISKKLSGQRHDAFIKETDPFAEDTFEDLHQKAEDIGVAICQLHYEGYEFCSQILKERTALAKSVAEEQMRLKAAEEQERLNDFQLEKKMARAEKQAQSDLEEVNQRLQIMDKEHGAKLEREMKEYRQTLDQEREIALVKSEYLKQLNESGVDLTTYLIAVVTGGKKKKKDAESNEAEEKNDSFEADFFASNLHD